MTNNIIIDSLPNIDLSARKLNFVSDSDSAPKQQPLLDSKMNIYGDFPEEYDYGANPYIFSDDYTYLNDIMYDDNSFSEPQPMIDDIDLEVRESNLILDSNTFLETSAILPAVTELGTSSCDLSNTKSRSTWKSWCLPFRRR